MAPTVGHSVNMQPPVNTWPMWGAGVQYAGVWSSGDFRGQRVIIRGVWHLVISLSSLNLAPGLHAIEFFLNAF